MKKKEKNTFLIVSIHFRKRKKDRKRQEKLRILKESEQLRVGGGSRGSGGGVLEGRLGGGGKDKEIPLARLRDAALVNLNPGERKKVSS